MSDDPAYTLITTAPNTKDSTVPENKGSDEVAERAAAAIQEANSGSNHQAGVDGDDDSVADRTADDGNPTPA